MKTPEELAKEVWDSQAFADFDPRGERQAIEAIAGGIRKAIEQCAKIAEDSWGPPVVTAAEIRKSAQ